MNGLLIQQLLWPPAARLEAEDEDDHGHDDADDDGGGCGNDDVVQFREVNRLTLHVMDYKYTCLAK